MDNMESKNIPTMDENKSVNKLEPAVSKKSKSGIISIIVSVIAILLSGYAIISGCKGEDAETMSNNISESEKTSVAPNDSNGAIAYVDTEILTSEYKFSVKLNEDFLTEQAKANASYESRVQKFQKKYESFMEKARLGSFISQASMDSQQQELAEEEMAIARYEREMTQKLMERQATITQQIYDTVINFIGEYNKDGRYSLVLNNARGSGVLYSDKMHDITDEVTKHLNERYEKATAGN